MEIETGKQKIEPGNGAVERVDLKRCVECDGSENGVTVKFLF